MNSPVEQIKSRLGIVDLVQSYIKLQRAGANFKAVCPFHNEKTPSFFVSPAREIWHCFSCNKGGDIFSFVMEIEGIDFPDALNILAQRSGLELKKQNAAFATERTKLFELIKDASAFYEKELSNNKDVLEYLKNRGLKSETIKKFQIGYSPGPPRRGWRNIYEFLRSKKHSDSNIEKSGLAIKKSSAEYYDRFRNRIMFPISDSSGRIIGFSGRIFGPEREGEGKYINTPQTMLYDKSRALYGFDKAKIEIRKKDCCVFVEGQMDAVMSHQAGFSNTVAVSGTALTLDHINMIKRLTSNAIVAFDNDEAGFSAAKRGIELLLGNGFEVMAVESSSEKDPADIIKNDPDVWSHKLNNSVHVINFYVGSLKRKFNDDRIFKKEVEKNVLPYLVFIKSEIEKNHWIGRIADVLKVKEESVWKEFRNISRESPAAKNVLTKSGVNVELEVKNSRAYSLEKRIIGLAFLFCGLIKDGDGRDELKEKFSKAADSVLEHISEGNRGIMETLGKCFAEFDLDENCRRIALEAELLYRELNAGEVLNELESLVADLKKEKIKDNLAELAEKISKFEKDNDQENLFTAIKEFNSLSKRLNER